MPTSDSVARGQHRREAETGGPRVIEQRRRHRARLRDQRDAAGPRHRARPAGVEADVRPHQPQAVRAQQAHLAPARALHDFLLDPADIRALVTQARRKHEHRRDSARGRVVDDARHVPRRGHDDGKVDLLRQRLQGRQAWPAVDGAVFRIDREHFAREACGQHVGHDEAAEGVRPVAGTDDGDGARRHGRAQIVDGVETHRSVCTGWRAPGVDFMPAMDDAKCRIATTSATYQIRL